MDINEFMLGVLLAILAALWRLAFIYAMEESDE